MELNKTLLLKRAIALYIDVGITTVFSMAIYESIFKNYNLDRYSFVMILTQLLMICRDVFGRSLGKICAKLYIVDFNNGDKTTLSQRILRNITGPVIIVEIFAILLREDHRRFGDVLAKTEVCHKIDNTKGILK